MSDAKQKHVTIRLRDVFCKYTEDWTGADEFYVIGGASSVLGKTSQEVLVKPIDINNGQTMLFPIKEGVVFEGDVQVGDHVELALQFYDEDFTNLDWNKEYAALATVIATAIGTAVGSVVIPGVGAVPGAVAGAILGASVDAFVSFLATADKDDLLGTVTKRIEVTDKDVFSGDLFWHFTKKSAVINEGGIPREVLDFWNDYEYTVRYTIEMSPA